MVTYTTIVTKVNAKSLYSGCVYAKFSKSKPFNNQTLIYSLNIKLVQYSYLHCMLFLKYAKIGVFLFDKIRNWS